MNATSNYKSAEGEREVMALYDAVLARWPVSYQALNIDTRHGHTFVIASGEASAPPLVLLHGSCSNAVSWAGEVAAYSSAFRVYAVDHPRRARTQHVQPAIVAGCMPLPNGWRTCWTAWR